MAIINGHWGLTTERVEGGAGPQGLFLFTVMISGSKERRAVQLLYGLWDEASL